MLSRLLFWAMLFSYLGKHFLSQKNWKAYRQYAFVRLGSVLQWLCCPWLNTGQLHLIFVILKAKHWLPFYFFRFICATFILSLWLVMWNLRDFCCQFFSHCLLLELLHVFKPHSILISWITLPLPYCWKKFLCCIPSIHSSEWYWSSPSYAFFLLLRKCPFWVAQQNHSTLHL